jgi:hypothetical protein
MPWRRRHRGIAWANRRIFGCDNGLQIGAPDSIRTCDLCLRRALVARDTSSAARIFCFLEALVKCNIRTPLGLGMDDDRFYAVISKLADYVKRSPKA